MGMPRVLVIDDQPHVRAMISITLQAHGFDVVGVESGPLGLSALEDSSFDLAIVDIYMPKMDGVQFIKVMREHLRTLPVIAMSGMMFRTSGRNVLDILPTSPGLTGVTCLHKPFKAKQLLQAIENATGVSAQQSRQPESV
jgi:CheY-like chemotaxis protein